MISLLSQNFIWQSFGEGVKFKFNLLTGKLICLSWSLYFCRNGKTCLLAGQVFIYNFFLSLEANLLQTFNFLFYWLLKNITKFCIVVLGLRSMTFGVITFPKINETFWLMKGMCYKYSSHMFTTSLFLISQIHTDFLEIIFDCAEYYLYFAFS